ncbi:MAG: glycosyltransferase 87 family protein [Ardenticatenaceae bacterium]|nr:glycosyltransferase 87 family protein [Ardenticatenaceae bacterium]
MRRAPLQLLLVLTAGQRLLTLLLLRPGGFIYDYSDYIFYHLIARYAAEGFYPFIHYWMEYPPLWPWLNVGLYRLSLLVPSWDDPRLVHSVLIGLTLLPFDLGGLILLHRLGERMWGRARATWLAAVWALLFMPLYIWSGWFDPILLFLLLLSTWFVVQGRPTAAGVAAGVGAMVKLTPALVLVTALPVWRRRGAPLWGWGSTGILRALAAFGAVVLAISLPFLLINPAMFVAMLRSLGARGSWETVWALLDGFYGFGVVGADRFDPAAAAAAPPSRVPWVLVHLGFAVLGLWLWTRPWDWRQPRVQVAFTGLVVTLFMLWSRGWSPQFLVWLLPWLLLVWPDRRGLLLALALTALAAAELIFFARWTATPSILAALIVLRTAGLVIVAVAAYRLLRAEPGLRPPFLPEKGESFEGHQRNPSPFLPGVLSESAPSRVGEGAIRPSPPRRRGSP